MFKKIVLGSDGSESALHAARVAAEIARRFNSEVLLVSVFDPAPLLMPISMAPEGVPPIDLVMSAADETHRHIQQKTSQVLIDANVAYQAIQEMGHPIHAITETAQNEKADLIVLGSRGLGDWQSLLLGSVADGVLHHAPCPVWIVRGKQTTFDKILLASDDSLSANHAADIAGELAQKLSVPLTLLNVVEPLGLIGHLLEEVTPRDYAVEARRFAQERLQSVAQGLGGNCCIEQETGQPAETIVRYARDHDFPLIVMGSRGRGGFQALTLGSVSSRVAHHAHCSLLFVR